MPRVGSQEFDYTSAGQKAARKASAKTGKPVVNARKPAPKTLPSQASSTARGRAFGQQGKAKRKAR